MKKEIITVGLYREDIEKLKKIMNKDEKYRDIFKKMINKEIIENEKIK